MVGLAGTSTVVMVIDEAMGVASDNVVVRFDSSTFVAYNKIDIGT